MHLHCLWCVLSTAHTHTAAHDAKWWSWKCLAASIQSAINFFAVFKHQCAWFNLSCIFTHVFYFNLNINYFFLNMPNMHVIISILNRKCTTCAFFIAYYMFHIPLIKCPFSRAFDLKLRSIYLGIYLYIYNTSSQR